MRVSPPARVPADQLRSIYERIAKALGAPDDEAAVFANCLLRADLRGKYTQGAALLPYLVSLVRDGQARFCAPWTVVSDTGPAAVVDGGYGMGSVVATRAMERAIEKAREYAIGVVWVRNGGDFAMASNHVLQATDQGIVGVAMRNGNPRVAPWGGFTPTFGTDPIALGVPCDGKPPMVIDMAAGSFSVGHTIMAARDGRKMPGPFITTQDGAYTDDPSILVADPADRESPFTGSIVSQGYRGYAWLLIVELFTGLLAGNGPSLDNDFEPSGDHRWTETMFFAAVDPARLLGGVTEAADGGNGAAAGSFARDAASLFARIAGMPPAEGFDRVRVPGWDAAAMEKEALSRGVALRPEVWDDLRRTAVDLDVDFHKHRRSAGAENTLRSET